VLLFKGMTCFVAIVFAVGEVGRTTCDARSRGVLTYWSQLVELDQIAAN
jgi:hypothetical protein